MLEESYEDEYNFGESRRRILILMLKSKLKLKQKTKKIMK